MTGVSHLGSIASLNSSIMIVLGDAAVAAGWQGAENGADDGDFTGSDWERCFRALHRDGFRRSATLPIDGGEVLAVSIDMGGWVDVFRVDERVVLVEPAYSNLADDTSAYSGLRRDAEFLRYLAAAVDVDATDAGIVTVASGSVAFLPSTSAAARDKVLVVTLPAGRYRVRVEDAVERGWGRAGRATLERVS